MPAGCPRTATPTKEEVIELGKDLVRWASEDPEDPKDKRTAWCFWYAEVQGMIKSQFSALKQLPEFRHYYEIARSKMAKRLHNEELEKGLCHRYLRYYDQDLADAEDETKRFDADLKRMSEQQVQDLLVKVISYADAKKSD